MTLRRTLTALALCVMALALFMGCVETGPAAPGDGEPPPPPPGPQLYFVNAPAWPSGKAPPPPRPRSAPCSSTMKWRSWRSTRAGPGWGSAPRSDRLGLHALPAARAG